MNSRTVRALFGAALAAAALAAHGGAPEAPRASHFRQVGYSELQGRGAFHATIVQQGERWIAYVGHMGGDHVNTLTGHREPNGTSLIEVTDPKAPRYLSHIPGDPGKDETGGARTVRVCSGSMLPSAQKASTYLLRSFGSGSYEVWDVSNPSAPSRVSIVARSLQATGRVWWECNTGFAYLVAGDQAWRTPRILRIYNLADPSNPSLLRRFGLPGQEPGSSAPIPFPVLAVRSTGPQGNRVYLGYGQRQGGVVQILDREKLLQGPRNENPESLIYPQIARHELPANATANMVLELRGIEIPEFRRQLEGKRRDFIAVTGRPLFKECLESRQMVWFVDVSTEHRPYGVSSWTVKEKSGDFCSRGGRFGAQASNENLAPVFAGRLLFIAHMNAGVRAVDVRNPFNPEEVGHFIPAVTRNTVVLDTPATLGQPPYTEIASRRAVQTTHVEVDDRGYIYALDRAGTGMHILELTGAARRIGNWSAVAK